MTTTTADKLLKFACKRPGFDAADYASATDYRRDCRAVAKDLRRCKTLAPRIDARGNAWLDARLSSGATRLRYTADGSIAYNAMQYHATEYRDAVADLLWLAIAVQAASDREGA